MTSHVLLGSVNILSGKNVNYGSSGIEAHAFSHHREVKQSYSKVR